MAIDPDVQLLLDAMQTEIDVLKTSGGGGSMIDTAYISFDIALMQKLLPLDSQGRATYLNQLELKL